jgi:peptidoglycan/xylan/chitin deacetylase (PgdA/CDA1 family)
MNNAFVISLDYELFWGIRDHTAINKAKQNLNGTRIAIPLMLQLFNSNGVKATWATVGILFASSKKELTSYIPIEKPNYKIKAYEPYQELDAIGENEEEDPYRFGFNPLMQIRNTKGQEIGTHTFSHYYCLEDGQTIHDFEADLKACVKISQDKFGSKIDSIVFPRNQFNEDYLAVLKNVGIKYYRSNRKGNLYQENAYLKANNKWQKLLRFIDRYINISGNGAFDINSIQIHNDLVAVPASRFFSPFNKKLSIFEPLKLERIKREMLYAAKNNLSYHLWWHPENFGTNINKNMEQLEDILKHYTLLKEKYNMKNCCMNEF